MNSLEIARFTGIFNVIAICAAAFFAVFGILTIVARKLGSNRFQCGAFMRAFCVAALVAAVLEVTVFNFQHYLKFFAGPELHTVGVSPDDPNVILMSDGTVADMRVITANDTLPPVISVAFRNIDRRVTSVFVDVDFVGTNRGAMTIQRTDEAHVHGQVNMLHKHLPHDNHAALSPHGKVSELIVQVRSTDTLGSYIDLKSISVNKPIPFYFSGLRLLVVSLMIFAIFVFFKKELRAKAGYYFLEYRFDPANKKQNIIYAAMVALLVLYSLVCVYTSVPEARSGWKEQSQQYNKYLVDALIAGRTYLDYGNPEKLLDAEHPYNITWLDADGYERNVDYMWDWAWYEGKYYSYFGVVPAVILYVPYKLITGNYLSNAAGVFLFSAIAVILMAMLWRFLVKKYMPNSRFVFYLFSFATLFFVSGLFGILRMPSFYTLVQSAGFMFAVAGILLLLKSVDGEKVNRLRLFFACLCFALIAGCRPNMVIVSFLVPVVLWKHKSWKLIPYVLIPVIIVAIPLCWYNYIRFGSIAEFGQRYVISYVTSMANESLNPIANAIKLFVTSISYLFTPNRYSLTFPYVECLMPANSYMAMFGVTQYSEGGSGLINYPIVFCLFYMLKNVFAKNKLQVFWLPSAMLAIAVVMIIMISPLVGFVARYAIDFHFLIIIPSLFCAYYWCDDSDSAIHPSFRLKTVYALMFVSVFVGMCLFVTGLSIHPYSDPVMYRYLEQSLGFIRNY